MLTGTRHEVRNDCNRELFVLAALVGFREQPERFRTSLAVLVVSQMYRSQQPIDCLLSCRIQRRAVTRQQNKRLAERAGCLHPEYSGFFESPAKYLEWYRRNGPAHDKDAPVVAVLLYRKWVVTAVSTSAALLLTCLAISALHDVPASSQHPIWRSVICPTSRLCDMRLLDGQARDHTAAVHRAASESTGGRWPGAGAHLHQWRGGAPDCARSADQCHGAGRHCCR